MKTLSSKDNLLNLVKSIQPYDELEKLHITDVVDWIESGSPLYRIEKPDVPPKHLVSYFILFDPQEQKILLVDHIKAQLWLPGGGHVDPEEDPALTATREAQEELGIEAELLDPSPVFVTIADTVGLTAGHTDVSLWYLLKGDCHEKLQPDPREFNAIRWFALDEIPYDRADPHLHRFVKKVFG